jgi:acetyltransferase
MTTAAVPIATQVQVGGIEFVGPRSSLVIVRPITSDDRAGFQSFVRFLSPASRYGRFQSGVSELSRAMLTMLTDVDHESHVALVAYAAGDSSLIAEARYVGNGNGTSGEIAIAVADAWQRKGLGTHLLNALIVAARTAGLTSLEGEVLRTNKAMRALAERAGFLVRQHPEARKVRITREIDPAKG